MINICKNEEVIFTNRDMNMKLKMKIKKAVLFELKILSTCEIGTIFYAKLYKIISLYTYNNLTNNPVR